MKVLYRQIINCTGLSPKKSTYVLVRMFTKKKIGIRFLGISGNLYNPFMESIEKIYLQFQELPTTDSETLLIMFFLKFTNLKTVSKNVIKKRINTIIFGNASGNSNSVCVMGYDSVDKELGSSDYVVFGSDKLYILCGYYPYHFYIPKDIPTRSFDITTSDLEDKENFLYYILKKEESS